MQLIGILLLVVLGVLASGQVQLIPENRNIAMIMSIVAVVAYLYQQANKQSLEGFAIIGRYPTRRY